MPDTPETPEFAALPEAEQVTARRWAPQLVWIIPILSLIHISEPTRPY